MSIVRTTVPYAIDGRAPSPREPSPAVVFQTQFRLIDMAQRFPLLVALLGVATAVGYQIWPVGIVPDAFLPLTPMLVVTLVWPLFVWYGEGPRQRLYHRAMPVHRLTHDWIKIAAGAVWLMLAVGIVAGSMWMMAWLSGYGPTLAALPFTYYLTYFTSTLLVYLIATLIPLLTDRPLEWLLGCAVGLSALGMLQRVYNAEADSITFVGELLQWTLVGMYRELPWSRLVYGVQPPYRVNYGSTDTWVITMVIWFSLVTMAIQWASSYAERKAA